MEGTVSELVEHPRLQVFINQLLSNAYCKGIECGVKLTRENANFGRGINCQENPIAVASLCKPCKRSSTKNSFAAQVHHWASQKLRERPGDYESLDKAMMAYVVTLARGFCVGSPEFDPQVFIALRDQAAESKPKCFHCGNHTCHNVGADARIRSSIDRTQFKNGVALNYSHPDQILVVSCLRCNV